MDDGRFVHRKQEIDLNWPAGEAASTTLGPDGAPLDGIPAGAERLRRDLHHDFQKERHERLQ